VERSLTEIRDHMIVCGFGRMGRFVCHEFSAQGLAFVVVEKRGELLEEFSMPHGIPLHGDATTDEMLQRAGVQRARGLVAVAGSDADNLYITMSARLLNARLFIVSRAEEEGARQKLLRAGANQVVSPYVIGGHRVAQAVLRPNVVDFIELATRTEHLELQMEETQIGPGSRLTSATITGSGVRQELGIIIVAVKKASGTMIFNPPADAVLEAGDILITLGNRQQLDRLEEMASG
jgi:voltage-gated potassium channel